jgi:hypothetical protein
MALTRVCAQATAKPIRLALDLKQAAAAAAAEPDQIPVAAVNTLINCNRLILWI